MLSLKMMKNNKEEEFSKQQLQGSLLNFIIQLFLLIMYNYFHGGEYYQLSHGCQGDTEKYLTCITPGTPVLPET